MPTRTEEFATHRYNLNQLMIADPDKIDELALYLQKTNHARARMRSRRFSRSGALIEALPQVKARLDGIWGERDATAYPHLDERARLLRGIQPAGPLRGRSRRRPLGAVRGGRPVQPDPRRVRRRVSRQHGLRTRPRRRP